MQSHKRREGSSSERVYESKNDVKGERGVCFSLVMLNKHNVYVRQVNYHHSM